MKWLFWLLLLLSLIFFVLMQWGGALLDDGKNMQPQPALNAEKIGLLPIQTDASSISAVSGISAAFGVSRSAVPAACVEWGEFFGNDLVRATAALSALNLGTNLTQRQVEHISGYWVYLPALKSRAEVDKEIAALKEIGVEEYFVVQEEGKWRNTISLGVFKAEDAAQRFLKKLVAKGVKSAKVGARKSKITLTVFVLKNPDAAASAKLTDLQKEFADSELKATACAN